MIDLNGGLKSIPKNLFSKETRTIFIPPLQTQPSLQPMDIATRSTIPYNSVFNFPGSTGTITWSDTERAQKACKRTARLETIARLAR